MATFIRFGAQRGINIEEVAEWTYTEKAPPRAAERRSAPASRAGAAPASDATAPEPEPTASMPGMHLRFTGGAEAEFEGDDALALHRYFRTVGSALT